MPRGRLKPRAGSAGVGGGRPRERRCGRGAPARGSWLSAASLVRWCRARAERLERRAAGGTAGKTPVCGS